MVGCGVVWRARGTADAVQADLQSLRLASVMVCAVVWGSEVLSDVAVCCGVLWCARCVVALRDVTRCVEVVASCAALGYGAVCNALVCCGVVC